MKNSSVYKLLLVTSIYIVFLPKFSFEQEQIESRAERNERLFQREDDYNEYRRRSPPIDHFTDLLDTNVAKNLAVGLAAQVRARKTQAVIEKLNNLEKAKKYEEAIDCLDSLIYMNQNNDYLITRRGIIHSALKKHNEAATDLKNAIQLNGNNEAALYWLALERFYYLNEKDEALSNIAQARTLQPKNLYYSLLQADMRFSVKSYDIANEDYLGALRLLSLNQNGDYGTRLYINFQIAITYYKLYHYSSALTYIETAKWGIVKKADYLYWYAKIELVNRRYRDAIYDINQALKIEPRAAEFYNCRGRAYELLNVLDSAMIDYNLAITYNKNYADSYNNKASVECKRQLLDTALQHCNYALKLDSSFHEPHIVRAYIYLGKKRYKEAVEECNIAILKSGYPEIPAILNLRGYTLYKLGKYKEAIADYDQAFQDGKKFYVTPDFNDTYKPEYEYREEAIAKLANSSKSIIPKSANKPKSGLKN